MVAQPDAKKRSARMYGGPFSDVYVAAMATLPTTTIDTFGEATLITVFVLFPISTPHTIAITITVFIAHTIVIPISTNSNSVRPNLNAGHLRENDCSGSLRCAPNRGRPETS